MELLERQSQLAVLEDCLTDAVIGHGRLIAIVGDAGAGKSALVREFVGTASTRVNVRIGACDPMTTPRPLGPLHDIATAGTPLADGLYGADVPARLFALLLDELRSAPTPTVIVVEDAHWADESTLDLLRYLARRIGDVAALVLVTYRDGETPVDHPIRLMLGDFAASSDIRILDIPPLTRTAVDTIAAERGIDGKALFDATGGNPFFVSEVIACGPEPIPTRVRDAVLARTARLPEDARAVLEIASLIPARIGPELAAAAFGQLAVGLDASLVSGMLVQESENLRFRHEIARLAVQSSVPPVRRQSIHRELLDRLIALGADPATLAHHAEAAGDRDAVLRYARQAADRAAGLGAHREAAAHLAAVLRHLEVAAGADRADLLDRLSYEYYLTDRIAPAIAARQDALQCWRSVGDQLRVGDALRWLSRLYWFAARPDDAGRAARQAVDVLQDEPPGHELAMAYSTLSQLAMLRDDVDDAVCWGTEALALGEELDDPEVVVHGLNNLGTVRYVTGHPAGIGQLERSLALAKANNMEEHVARAYTNLLAAAGMVRDVDVAVRYGAEGLAYAVDHDLDAFRWYITGWRARLALALDDWERAENDAMVVLRAHDVTPVSRLLALATVARIQARRGEDATALLDEALSIALATKEPQRIAPVLQAVAETAWLRNTTLDEDLLDACRLVLATSPPWDRAELAVWLQRLGQPMAIDDVAADIPYAATLRGSAKDAGDAWLVRGNRYEAALAAVDGDDVHRLRAAAEWLIARGAAAVLPRVSQRLRELGSTGVRGPRRSTAANPSLLTERELDVLRLVAARMSDRQIAQRLVLSPRTVHHHVQALLRKLEVDSRHDAARKAGRLGILVPEQQARDRRVRSAVARVAWAGS